MSAGSGALALERSRSPVEERLAAVSRSRSRFDWGLAAAGPAAYLMFSALLPQRPGVRWLAAGLGVPLPFWAAIQEAGGDQFHPENLALALALFAGWAGVRGHRKLMWTCALLVLCCKEDQVYTVGILGLLVISRGSD